MSWVQAQPDCCLDWASATADTAAKIALRLLLKAFVAILNLLVL